MNTNIRIRKLVWGTLLALAPACGGEDESATGSPATGGTVKSGVPPEKAVNSLSEAEAKQVSASFSQAIQTSGLLDALCAFTGILGEQFGAAAGQTTTCEQLATECKAAPTESTESTLSVQDDPAQLASCTVTVGELEGCMNAMLTTLGQSLGGVNCDSDIQMVMQSFVSGKQVAACEKVNTTCPTVLSGASNTQTTP